MLSKLGHGIYMYIRKMIFRKIFFVVYSINSLLRGEISKII